MSQISRFLIAAAPLALTACIQYPADTGRQTVERGTQNAGPDLPCWYRTYRPTPDDKTPYDAVIPPTYDAPGQLPSYCNKDFSK